MASRVITRLTCLTLMSVSMAGYIVRYDGQGGWELETRRFSTEGDHGALCQLIHHPPTTIRLLGAAEWQLKRDLRLAALQDSPRAFASSYDLEVHRSAEGWRNWPRDGVYFAAFDDLQAALGIAGSWMRASQPDVTHLISMWVAPDARGAGIAGLLTTAVVEWALERKAARVELEVAAGNDAAMRAYMRSGFIITKRVPSTPGGVVLERALSVSPLT